MEEIDNASNERQGSDVPVGGPGKLRGKDNPKPFTSTYQPGAEKSAKTRRAQADARKLLANLLNRRYYFKKGSQLKEQLETAFGKEIKNLSALELMGLQQIQKAILQSDTFAFQTVLNQALGMPKQEIETPNDRIPPNIIFNLPEGVDINLPSNTDGESIE